MLSSILVLANKFKIVNYKIGMMITKSTIYLLHLFLILLLSACGASDSMRDASKNNPVTYARMLAADNGCMGCHSVGVTVVGPAWRLVAKRYKDQPAAKEFLIEKIKHGGKGNWDDLTAGKSMPGHKDRMTDEEISVVVDYILKL